MSKIALFLLLNFLAVTCNDTAPQTPIDRAPPSLGKEEIVKTPEEIERAVEKKELLLVGAQQSDLYIPLLEGKTVGLVVNQTSTVGDVHLVDFLLQNKVNIKTIFAPEHGFRGNADAGELVKNGKDVKTDIPLISLYGKRKKPLLEDIAGLDIIVFDIQDVGARFYTYISTMSYVMEACAENKIPFLVLDRPNPNGHYIDGPILQKDFSSFVGLHPVPVVHGMTVGEYAQMVNGEGWLKNGVECNLEVIKCANYEEGMPYELPLKPSPNLPNMRAIYLYPSLCFFEGTVVNVGRGTDHQFQVYGAPRYGKAEYIYTPEPKEGAKHPKHEGQECRGYQLMDIFIEDLRNEKQLNLSYLIQYYKNYPDKENFFLKNNFFDKLAGTDQLRLDIIAGKSEEEIRSSWKEGLDKYRERRKAYLLY